jgi:hypothetical protein
MTEDIDMDQGRYTERTYLLAKLVTGYEMYRNPAAGAGAGPEK